MAVRRLLEATRGQASSVLAPRGRVPTRDPSPPIPLARGRPLRSAPARARLQVERHGFDPAVLQAPPPGVIGRTGDFAVLLRDDLPKRRPHERASSRGNDHLAGRGRARRASTSAPRSRPRARGRSSALGSCAGDANEVEALALADDAPLPRERVLALVDDRAGLGAVEPRLLAELAQQGLARPTRPRRCRRRASPTSRRPLTGCSKRTSSTRPSASTTSAAHGLALDRHEPLGERP